MYPVCSYKEARAEVDTLIDQVQGNAIEEKIKSLVAALRMFGLHTIQSCEGHLDGRKSRFPFVQIEPLDLGALAEIVAYQNRLDRKDQPMHDNQWVIHPTVNVLTVQPELLNLSLEKLQENADGFSKTLRRLAGEINI